MYKFFFGHRDLEIDSIIDLLVLRACDYWDSGLSWGAGASAYREDIDWVVANNKIPVLVGLKIDIELPLSAIVLNHSEKKPVQESPIIQVIKLLGMTPGRDEWLVAANATGYIPALKEIGATEDEIRLIRHRDRKVGGITEEMEKGASLAGHTYTFIPGANVMVPIIYHNNSVCLADNTYKQWLNGNKKLLVVCLIQGESSEYHYYGDPAFCEIIRKRFSPNSWGGGGSCRSPNTDHFVGVRGMDAETIMTFMLNPP